MRQPVDLEYLADQAEDEEIHQALQDAGVMHDDTREPAIERGHWALWQLWAEWPDNMLAS